MVEMGNLVVSGFKCEQHTGYETSNILNMMKSLSEVFSVLTHFALCVLCTNLNNHRDMTSCERGHVQCPYIHTDSMI